MWDVGSTSPSGRSSTPTPTGGSLEGVHDSSPRPEWGWEGGGGGGDGVRVGPEVVGVRVPRVVHRRRRVPGIQSSVSLKEFDRRGTLAVPARVSVPYVAFGGSPGGVESETSLRYSGNTRTYGPSLAPVPTVGPPQAAPAVGGPCRGERRRPCRDRGHPRGREAWAASASGRGGGGYGDGAGGCGGRPTTVTLPGTPTPPLPRRGAVRDRRRLTGGTRYRPGGGRGVGDGPLRSKMSEGGGGDGGWSLGELWGRGRGSGSGSGVRHTTGSPTVIEMGGTEEKSIRYSQ